MAAAAVAAAALLLCYYCSMHAILGRPLHVPLHHFDCNRSGAATALPPPAAALRCRQAQVALNTTCHPQEMLCTLTRRPLPWSCAALRCCQVASRISLRPARRTHERARVRESLKGRLLLFPLSGASECTAGSFPEALLWVMQRRVVGQSGGLLFHIVRRLALERVILLVVDQVLITELSHFLPQSVFWPDSCGVCTWAFGVGRRTRGGGGGVARAWSEGRREKPCERFGRVRGARREEKRAAHESGQRKCFVSDARPEP